MSLCRCSTTKHPPCTFCENGGFICADCQNSYYTDNMDKECFVKTGETVCRNCVKQPCETCNTMERRGNMLSRNIGYVCYNCEQQFIENNGCMAGFDCKKVNIGLMFDKWVCKHCGKDME